VGEIAAAHVAGALDLASAVRLAVLRGRVMQSAPPGGRMAQVPLSFDEAQDLVASYGARLAVAAHNGPRESVLSGDEDALAHAVRALDARGVAARSLAVRYAFHSAQMDALCAPLADALAWLAPAPPRLPIASTLTGLVDPAVRFDASYWVRQLRQPVQLAHATAALAASSPTVFVEIGPHPVLAASLRATLDGHLGSHEVLASGRRGGDERASMLRSAARLYERGADLQWDAVHARRGRCVSLPGYSFQRERLWIEPAPRREPVRGATGGHPLLGRHIALAELAGHHVWEVELDAARLPWLAHHRMHGAIVFPGSGYLEMALAAASEAFGAGAYALENVEMVRALVVPELGTVKVQVTVSARENGRARFRVHRAVPEDGSWMLHATGEIAPQA
jgi:myxalamid-type polyketide synthase MxaE and MxaD